MTAQIKEFFSITSAAFQFAVRDFFEPLFGICLYLGRLISHRSPMNNTGHKELQVQEATGNRVIRESDFEPLADQLLTIFEDKLSSMLEEQRNELQFLAELKRHKHLDWNTDVQQTIALSKLVEFRNFADFLQATAIQNNKISEIKKHLREKIGMNSGDDYYFALTELSKMEGPIHLFFADINEGMEIDSRSFRILISRALLRRALVDFTRHKTHLAASLTRRSIEVLERTDDRKSLCASYIQLFGILWRSGMPDEAISILEEARNVPGLSIELEKLPQR